MPYVIDTSVFQYRFGTKNEAFSDLHIIRAKQVHSTNVVQVTHQAPERMPEADGIVTVLKGVPIGVITADCVPMLFADPIKKIIAVSHQGWKGTYNNMPARMITSMASMGSVPSDIRVGIGPSIGPCCYRIYGERYDMFRERFGTYSDRIFVGQADNIYLHLAALNRFLLMEAGVREQHIELPISCTKCDSARYYSFQRDGSGCGHMISYIMMT
ncbi:MAG: hypothetical protein RI947_1476 [Candidatus Parcubacteria bacterium]|jgi:YfiH family protein